MVQWGDTLLKMHLSLSLSLWAVIEIERRAHGLSLYCSTPLNLPLTAFSSFNYINSFPFESPIMSYVLIWRFIFHPRWFIYTPHCYSHMKWQMVSWSLSVAIVTCNHTVGLRSCPFFKNKIIVFFFFFMIVRFADSIASNAFILFTLF